MYGSYVDAPSDEEAMTEAAKLGYEPVEVIEHGDDLVVVVL
jgi:hypothetical protein